MRDRGRGGDACGGGGGGSGGGRMEDGGEDKVDKVEVEVPEGCGEPNMTPV